MGKNTISPNKLDMLLIRGQRAKFKFWSPSRLNNNSTLSNRANRPYVYKTYEKLVVMLCMLCTTKLSTYPTRK